MVHRLGCPVACGTSSLDQIEPESPALHVGSNSLGRQKSHPYLDDHDVTLIAQYLLGANFGVRASAVGYAQTQRL